MKKTVQVLNTIGELGFVEIHKDGRIGSIPPSENVHHARMQYFLKFLGDYVKVHRGCHFQAFFTLYDAWREHAEPSPAPKFCMLSQRLLERYRGTGTVGEGGRFIQPFHLKNVFPVFESPVLAFGRHSNDPFVQLVPDTDFVMTDGYTALRSEVDLWDSQWEQKSPLLFWRGSRHGYPYRAYDPAGKMSQRELLVEWSRHHAHLCDAAFSHRSTKQEQLQYKYLLDVDGEVNAWSGFYWKLYSRSVVFKVMSHYEQWYYPDLRQWVHFIPVRGDLGDLHEKYEWALRHDEECRLIAETGRLFAAALTYQHALEGITLRNDTGNLFESKEVARMRSLPRVSKPPVVVHTYQPLCHTVAQPPGLGDYLRGTIALYQLSLKYGFTLKTDITSHPLSACLKQHDRFGACNENQVHEFFNERNSLLEPFVAGLEAGQNQRLFTHAVPTGPLDDPCRSFLLKRLQPLPSLNRKIKRQRDRLLPEQYCTVHIRLGDEMLNKPLESLPPLLFDWFEKVIVTEWGSRVLVISDNQQVPRLLHDRFGVVGLDAQPVHLGQCEQEGAQLTAVADTMAEFFLMSASQKIYQYSVYPWGSSFSDICAKLYKIPLERIDSETFIAARSVSMPPESKAGCKPNESHKKVLNVGGNTKAIAIPDYFAGWQHDLLDIDPRGNPDVLCDARELWKLPPRTYDAIYCSHNLEHYYKHDVKKVLKGFRMVLKKDGFALIRVPDLYEVMQHVVIHGLDLDDVLYTSPSGPILVSDVIYGWNVEIERSGNDFFAHKTGFTTHSLERTLKQNGFACIYIQTSNLEIIAHAFLQEPGQDLLAKLCLPRQ